MRVIELGDCPVDAYLWPLSKKGLLLALHLQESISMFQTVGVLVLDLINVVFVEVLLIIRLVFREIRVAKEPARTSERTTWASAKGLIGLPVTIHIL